ncbi:MAG: DUF4292 domain-containing protein [Barnesiella sp.]|nr:DUF4292 domain-containing protein [Barnesiella sp.]
MKLMMKRLSVLAVAAAAVMTLTLTGCRSSRTVASGSKPVAEMTLDEKVVDVAAHNLPWTQLNMPVKVAVKSPQKLSVSGRIYMRRDRDIYITLRVLGMEVANLYIDSDSVFAADKIHKYYIAEPIRDIFAGATLTIGDIQDALLGRPFINNAGEFTVDNIRDVTAALLPDESWSLTPRSLINGRIGYSFEFDGNDNSLKALSIDVNGKQYGCTYADPATLDGSRFMQQLTIKTNAGKTAVDATLTYDLGKANPEIPASATWRTPKNYKRISPRSLLKALD